MASDQSILDRPAEAASVPEEPRSLHQRAWRVVRRVLTAIAILFAVGFVTLFSVDLGPWLRERAERAGADYLKRDVHIGRLSARLLRGHFVVEDFRIGGLAPTDRPFFTAKQIVAKVPWGSLIRRELIIESVELTDWHMVVEQFKDGRHNFPKFTPDDDGTPKEPKRFHTTVHLVRATRGTFTYDDHEAPWSIVAPNLQVVVSHTDEYRGEALFKEGVVRIAHFEPMWAKMHSTFKIDDGKVLFDRIALDTDGAQSIVTGTTDLGHWPEQIYYMRSRVQFPRMRELFFATDHFTLGGEGNFVGSFHLFKGGRKLEGRFTSEEAKLNDWRFPGLDGALVWERHRFEVTNASSGFYGGKMNLDFSMKPLGDPVEPARGRLDTRYERVDLTKLTDTIELKGLRLAGAATGRHVLDWPVGRFHDRAGDGEISVEPPAGITLQSRTHAGSGPDAPDVSGADAAAAVVAALTTPETQTRPSQQAGKFVLGAQGDEERRMARAARAARAVHEAAFDPVPLRAPLAVGGHLKYRYSPDWIDVEPGWAATRHTYVELQGRTAYGERSQLPFHVTSSDWQESDRVLAGAIIAFGASAHAIAFGGSGTFDGTMTGAFRQPRVEGRFAGDRVHAWDVYWGHAEAQVAIEHSYVDVTNGVITRGDSRIDLEGRYSLGYPRDDNGEEINTRVRMTRRAIGDLKHAFDLDEYRVSGQFTGEFHLYGKYTRPFGFGKMTIDRGTAYGESFDTASAGLRFEGTGVRLDGLRLAKGTGDVSGAAYIDWQGHYSFNADGRRIPVEKIDALAYPSVPLYGVLTFTASGSGTFEAPRYEVRGRVDDLFIVDEGIGQVTGQLTVRGDLLTIDRFEAASPRLAVSGAGKISLAGEADADLNLRFNDTSIDPYVRLFNPQVSPFTTAIASGTIHAKGTLRDLARLRVDGRVEDIDLRLFDYRLRNDGPITLTLVDNVARIEQLKVVGQGTTMQLLGDIVLGSTGLGSNRVRIRMLGDANLSILQGFMRDIRSSGAAQVQAEIAGPLDAPALVGSATIADGRVRYFGLPHSLESVNGRVEFDASGVRVDGLTGRMGGGDVRFGGRIGTKGATITSFALTAVGHDMRVRYPEGFRSVVDTDLALRGLASNPTLTGTVRVKDALWVRSIDTDTAVAGGWAAVRGSKSTSALAAGGAGAVGTAGTAGAASGFPLRFDVRIDAPSALRIENSTARLVSSADLTLRGTYDKPLLFGRAEINRGEVFFEGNRYVVTRGTIDFSNPSRIDPFFDIEAETRARVPGETYRVTFRVTGTKERFVWDLTSDPPLATVDILALLFGQLSGTRDAELRGLRYREQTEQELFATRAARLLTSPISSEVNRVVKKTFGVDSVQIAPSIGDVSGQESARITPTARLTIGKRISDRLFLTYAQPLTSSRTENLVLVEYTQSDRFAWIVSRNEDETYALEVRVRHVF